MEDWRIAAGAGGALRRRLRASRPSKTCRTRSPGSPPRTRASTPSCIRRARDGAVLPIAEFPDEIVFHPRARRHHRACRGSRSRPGSPPTSRTSRRSAPARSPPAAPAPTSRSSPGSPPATPRRTTMRRRLRSSARSRSSSPARAARLGPCSHGPRTHAARRVQSPPRGRPHALRRRTHRVVEPVARRARDRRRAGRAPERPRAHRRQRRGRRRARHQRARHHHGAGARRRRHRTRYRVHGVRAARRRRPQRPRRHRPRAVTELRVETTR